eukprot:gene6255-7255_t
MTSNTTTTTTTTAAGQQLMQGYEDEHIDTFSLVEYLNQHMPNEGSLENAAFLKTSLLRERKAIVDALNSSLNDQSITRFKKECLAAIDQLAAVEKKRTDLLSAIKQHVACDR